MFFLEDFDEVIVGDDEPNINSLDPFEIMMAQIRETKENSAFSVFKKCFGKLVVEG